MSAVAAANKRTVVVVVAPGAVLLPWSEQVPAIVVSFPCNLCSTLNHSPLFTHPTPSTPHTPHSTRSTHSSAHPLIFPVFANSLAQCVTWHRFVFYINFYFHD